MSNALTTNRSPMTLSWATKSGTSKAAHSEAAQSRAPSTIRHAQADSLTLFALQNGQYRPFLADVRAGISKAHSVSLVAAVAAALTVVQDGVSMVPTGDILAVSNKKAARAVAEWLQNPTIEKTAKGVTAREAKPLPKGKLYLSAIAAQWLQTMQDANMGADISIGINVEIGTEIGAEIGAE